MYRSPQHVARTRSTTTQLRGESPLRHYSLPTALLAGHRLSLNTHRGTLSYLINEQGQPHIVFQEEFTATEVVVLLPLLDHYPNYCPHEVLYACFYRSDISEEVVNRCREHLLTAMAAGTWDQEMRAVRSAVSRLRLKLHHFGIDILTLLATGYVLSFEKVAAALAGAGAGAGAGGQEPASNVVGLHHHRSHVS